MVLYIFPLFNKYKQTNYSNYISKALLVGRVFNLVTKERYWMNPVYATMRQCLTDLKRQCKAHSVNKLAMPKIGCGLDRMDWKYVKQIIQDVFRDTNIEIIVFYI